MRTIVTDIPFTPSAEVIAGILDEGNLCALSGEISMGKSPLLQHLAICAINGLPFLGHAVARRPVILIDYETPRGITARNLTAISTRYHVPVPHGISQVETYTFHDDCDCSLALKALSSYAGDRAAFLATRLQVKPNALILLDPVELFFPLYDRNKHTEIQAIYSHVRTLLSNFPAAACIMTFNLRKPDRRIKPPSLSTDPRAWLNEVSGSADISTRSDVRLGIDLYDRNPEVRILNGIRRGEVMSPTYILPRTSFEGFDLYILEPADVFAPMKLEYWQHLPQEFRLAEVRDHVVPHSTLQRLISEALAHGLLRETAGGVFVKVAGSL